jgi:hypothetical protein
MEENYDAKSFEELIQLRRKLKKDLLVENRVVSKSHIVDRLNEGTELLLDQLV